MCAEDLKDIAINSRTDFVSLRNPLGEECDWGIHMSSYVL